MLPPMETPIRRQYLDLKRRYPHAILFFRLGDFYETFDDDALVVARELEIVLTSREMGRGQRVPLAGVPHHSLETHLARLLKRGYRVAVCEQMADPAATKGLVPRDVVRVVTPGTVVEPDLLTSGENNYLAALIRQRDQAGLAYADVSTGEFCCTQFGGAEVRGAIAAELRRLRPAELLVPAEQAGAADEEDGEAEGEPALLAGQQVSAEAAWLFAESDARLALQEHFGVAALEGFGCAHLPLAISAAGALIAYLRQNQKAALAHLQALTTYHLDQYMQLDEATARSLEIWSGNRHGEARNSLLAALDGTVTSMGARLLRRRLGQPLLELAPLLARQAKVTALRENDDLRRRLRAALAKLPDFERLAGRVTTRTISPRELGSLRTGLAALPELAALLGQAPAAIAASAAALPDFAAQHALLARALVDEPPAALGPVRTIRPQYAPELDAIEASAVDAKAWVAALEGRERARTGIRTLKVGFNKVFGYYLEITNAHAARVPSDYERRQTLAGAERYVTPELKDYEARVLGAEERMAVREAELFGALRAAVGQAIARIQRTARVLARLDVWTSLAERAVAGRFVRPAVHDGFDLVLRESRHPVIERMMARESFIPNDARFTAAERVALVTGPNMAGKSTILRQIGLCVVLAQMGSFVPAAEASVGVVDRLFTRVGASDDLARGQSTFMVEMSETSAILHNAGPRSLVLLDEIGRGTSTYDGVAIAWAVTEHLHDRVGCKTMFATHYHELMQLPERLQHARNYNVAVRETGDTVVFLHRLEPGGTDRSYGIHVAQLAGLPDGVVRRAREILGTLEGEHRMVPGAPPEAARDPGQLALFTDPPADPMLEELRLIDVNALTPLEALNRLAELKRRAEDRR
jgi:DNA mismatch repair protein MutS